jgi:hypothetical protein
MGNLYALPHPSQKYPPYPIDTLMLLCDDSPCVEHHHHTYTIHTHLCKEFIMGLDMYLSAKHYFYDFEPKEKIISEHIGNMIP